MKELWIQALALASYMIFGLIAYLLNLFEKEKGAPLRRQKER